MNIDFQKIAQGNCGKGIFHNHMKWVWVDKSLTCLNGSIIIGIPTMIHYDELDNRDMQHDPEQ